jgi:predicted RNA-binding Zn ribbon-like protein
MEPTPPEPLDLIGGLLCLDFANTVGPRFSRPDKEAHDYLAGFDDLVDWCTRAETMTSGRAGSLKRRAERDPQGARAAMDRAIVLRETIFEIFSAIARDETPAPNPLAVLQETFAEAMSRATLQPTPRGLGWTWDTVDEPDSVLWPLAESAMNTAVGADFGRIKQCAGHAGSCGWLFYDSSKNGSRRWCSMRACGTWTKNHRQATH